jgi:hypothetical protein
LKDASPGARAPGYDSAAASRRIDSTLSANLDRSTPGLPQDSGLSTQHFIAFLLVVAFAAYLRVPFLQKSATSDEISLIDPRGVQAILFGYETRSNPPLHRLLINVPFRDAGEAWRAGQALSLIATLAAMMFAFSLALRLTDGSLTAAMAAALMIGANPVFLQESTRFRSYAPWMAVAMWQWHALARVVDEESDRRARIEFIIATALLPWLHYTSVLMLAAEAVALIVVTRTWRTIMLFIPAAIAALPLAWIFHAALGSQYPQPQDRFIQRLLRLGGGGLVSLEETRHAFHNLLSLFALFIPVALVIAIIAKHRVARVAAIAYCGTLLAITLLGEFRLVRPPGAVWLLPMIIVFVTTAPLRLPSPRVRVAAFAIVTFIAIVNGFRFTTHPELGDAVSSVAGRLPRVLERARDGELHVLPDYAAHLLLFDLQKKTGFDLPHVEGCEEGNLCWTEGGVHIIGGGQPPEGSLVLIFREPQSPWPSMPCRLQPLHTDAVLADCRPSISTERRQSGEAEQSASVHPR